jgi:5'-deoxynucleotidase YfbR-like HD superfamily hydrolase
VILEEEIQDLVEKLEKLQRSSGVKGLEAKNYSNFDKQTSLLQRRLEKFGAPSDEICDEEISSVKEIREMAEASLSIKTGCRIKESFVSSGKCNVRMICLSLISIIPYFNAQSYYSIT